MAVTTDIPVEVTPEAAARVAELGLQQEFAAILEHTRQSAAGLSAIEARLRYNTPEDPDEPRVIITAVMNGPSSAAALEAAWDRWVDWFVRAYPSAVSAHFGFRTEDRADYER